MRNTQRTAARVSLLIALGGALAFVAVPVLDIDIFSGGGAMLMAGLLVGITGLVAAWLFAGRAAMLDNLRRGDDVLARWEYDADTWASFAQVDLGESTAELTGLRWLVMVISAVVCGVLFFVLAEARWVFPVVFVAINALIWLVCALRIRSITAKARRRGPATVTISRHAAEVAGELHVWKGPLLSFEGAQLKGRDPVMLAITYSVWVRYGRQYHTARIPVPEGRLEQAQQIVKQLRQSK